MEIILKYLYTKEFKVDVKDIVPVWMMTDKLQLSTLQEECESIICKNLTKDNVADIKQIADQIGSKKVSESCASFDETSKKSE